MELASVRLPLRVLADAGGWSLARWLVAPGAPVYRNQRVAALESLATGAVDHALAPHSGTLVRALIAEGATIAASIAAVGEIQFCPHSVVFNGLCAVCGEDAEAAHFADTAAAVDARLPVAYNATTLSVTRAEAESVASVTTKRLFDARRLSLVLDLDHTLVHATDDPRAAAVLHHSPQGVDVGSVSSFALRSTPGSAPAPPCVMHVKLRPHLTQFLARAAAKFELHIYTMGSRPYADRIACLIDPDKRLFSGRITSREDFAEGRCNQKSIRRLFPCDDSMVLIVDDREDVWISGTGEMFMPNLIRADPYSFWHGLHEAYDRASNVGDNDSESGDGGARGSEGRADGVNSQPLPAKHAPGAPKKPDGDVVNADQKTSAIRDCSAASASGDDFVTDEANGKSECGMRPNPASSSSAVNGTLQNDAVQLPEAVPVTVEKEAKSGQQLAFDVQLEKDKENGDKESGKTLDDASVAHVEENAPSKRDAATMFSVELRRSVQGWWETDSAADASGHLLRLAKVLEDCHTEFFARAKRLQDSQQSPDAGDMRPFQIPVSVKNVLADMRLQVLKGCVITFTGIVPTGVAPETVHAWNLATRLGATCSRSFVNGVTTHVITTKFRNVTTQKCSDAVKSGTVFIVTLKWLEDSAMNFERRQELAYSCTGWSGDATMTPEAFREYIGERHKKVALTLQTEREQEAGNGRGINGDDRSSDEEARRLDDAESSQDRPTKRQKMDADGATTDLGAHVHSPSSNGRVLSGDEIGDAFDLAFD